MTDSDFAVVGGGLLGSAVAYQLARHARTVLLIDRDDPGRATSAGAGILAPHTNPRLEAEILAFALAAARYYPQLADELRAHGIPEIGYGRARVLVVAGRADDLDRFAEIRDQLLGLHPDVVRDVNAAEAVALCPPITAPAAALLSAEGARVDGRLLNAALLAAGRRRGVSELTADVVAIQAHPDRAEIVLGSGQTRSARSVVIAAGAWTAGLVAGLGVNLPVVPQRGQIVHLQVDRADTGSWAIVEGLRGHYLLPWPGGRIVAGATRESGAGFEPLLTAGGCLEVVQEALRLAPSLRSARIREWRVGLRPLSQLARPIVGRLPGSDVIAVATGHGADGLLLGPYSARLLADSLLSGRSEPRLAQFAVPGGD